MKVLVLSITIAVALWATPALAAPPYSVEHDGTPVKAAALGEAVKLNLKVTNTGTTVYSGVKVIVTVPNGLKHSGVSPSGADIVDNTITWMNVPIQSGGVFKPSVTLAFDDGVSIGEKLNVWVQVTGGGLEANSQNFSLTAVATKAGVKTSTPSASGSSLVPKINSIHRIVYGRNPTASEHAYWWGRVRDGSKAKYGALLGAMQFHNLNGITH